MITYASSGLFTHPDAGTLLGEQPSTIRRWAYGYTRRGVRYDPPIHTEIPEHEGVRLLTFLELVELMFIQGFLRAGVSWAKVRSAAVTAARLLRDERHPFAMKRWFADPAGIYLSLGRQHGENILVEVAGDAQVAIHGTLEPYLHQIEFDITGLAQRWYPLGQDRPIVVDPRRAHGAPVIESGGVRTDLLFSMHAAGDDVSTIASWYEVDEYEVQAAIDYESTIKP